MLAVIQCCVECCCRRGWKLGHVCGHVRLGVCLQWRVRTGPVGLEARRIEKPLGLSQQGIHPTTFVL